MDVTGYPNLIVQFRSTYMCLPLSSWAFQQPKHSSLPFVFRFHFVKLICIVWQKFQIKSIFFKCSKFQLTERVSSQDTRSVSWNFGHQRPSTSMTRTIIIIYINIPPFYVNCKKSKAKIRSIIKLIYILAKNGDSSTRFGTVICS
jgi:hypothetical protein